MTDGSPLDMQDAHALGLATREEYAEIRRRELRDALTLVPVAAERCLQFSFIDKETMRNLVEIVEVLEEFVSRVQPDVVLAPAYEGGHPDHDAAAFAVAMVARRRGSFHMLEFPLYHAGEDGDMVIGEFAGGGPSEQVIQLAAEECYLKRKMVACFRSQAEFISGFPISNERFRPATVHNFTEPPHPGPLLYERWGWGISGEEWRQCAKEAYSRITGRSGSSHLRCP